MALNLPHVEDMTRRQNWTSTPTHDGLQDRDGADRPVRVLKFGGTSVTGGASIDVIARVVRSRMEDSRPVLVVSALAGVTDLLHRAAMLAVTGAADEVAGQVKSIHREVLATMTKVDPDVTRAVEALLLDADRLIRGIRLVGECSARTLDQVLSLGERLSVRLVTAGLRAHGLPVRAVDACGVIVTDDQHGQADVSFEATEAKAARLLADEHSVPVVTGFIGATASGERTTLGRGGSDYSAAVLGWALRAEEVEIWTDVTGVMTADPRTVPDARPLRALGFNELLELSHWGARVVHPKTVRALRDSGIPLSIRNTLSPDDPGTRVTQRALVPRNGPVRGIASIDRVALLQLNGFGRGRSSVSVRFLRALDEANCPIVLLSQGCSERSICAALALESVERALGAVEDAFDLERRAGLMDTPTVEEDCSVVAVVGEGMKDTPGIAGRVLSVLGDEGISVRAIAQGSSELNISLVVRHEHVDAAVRAIHGAFFGTGIRDASSTGRPGAIGTPGIRSLAFDAGGRRSLDVVELATELIAIPSVSGHEHAVTDFVTDLLSRRGWDVHAQSVTGGRSNIWATRGRGDVTLTTHLDTVPNVFSPRLEGGRLYGRGACDAKGIVAAMICAAQRLVTSGAEGVDLLFLVGEEAGSDGARAAASLPATSRFLVNGEPTESRLVSASKGSLRALIRTRGREAHSAYPELGRSAVESMVAALGDLAHVALPADRVLGETTVNPGVIRGGTTANVIAENCEVELMIRLVGDPTAVQDALIAWADERAELEWGSIIPPQRFHVIDGFETATVAYTSDVPLLGAWGTPLMYGPGSIHYAHTSEEHIEISDLRGAVEAYEQITRTLMAP